MNVSVKSTLEQVHATSVEQLRSDMAVARPCGLQTLFAGLIPPHKLQFRLRYFVEHDSTDSFLQGAGDEVYISAIGVDSSSVKVGPDRHPAVDLLPGPPIGDVTDNAVRDGWRSEPYTLVEYDLRQPGDWPRTYTTTLLIIESDNGDLAEGFAKLQSQVGGVVKTAVIAAAGEASAALAGAAIGSVVPGVGTAVGAAVGALAGAAFDSVVGSIADGLADDIFSPIPISMTLSRPWLATVAPGIDTEQTCRVQEHGGDYDIIYDWHIVR